MENEVRIPVDHRQLRKGVYLIGPAMVLASAAAAWFGTADLLALAAGGAIELPFWLGPVGVVGVVFFSAAWWSGFSTLKRGSSALVVDANGIEPPATVGGRSDKIAWSDVEGWHFGYVAGSHWSTSSSRTRTHFSGGCEILRVFGRGNIRLVGTPVSVQLTNLGVSFEVIDEALTRFSGITQPDENADDEYVVAEDTATSLTPAVPGPDRQHQWIWAGVLVGTVVMLMTVGLSTTGGQDMRVTGFPWWFAIAVGAGMVALMTFKDLLYGETTPDLVACVAVTGETRPRESWIPTAMADELAGEMRRTGLDAQARYQPTAVIFWAGTSLIGASIGSAGLGQLALGGDTVTSWTLIVVGSSVLFAVADAPRWGWVRRRLLRTS